jgi:hypothetical protein
MVLSSQLCSNSGDFKKTTISNSQCLLNVIQQALKIDNFVIDYPVLLEINCEIAIMGGGQFSSCQKIGLSLFVVCLFFGVI